MKLKTAKHLSNTAIGNHVAAQFSLTEKETKDLVAALKLVKKYKTATIDACRDGDHFDPETSDWHMTEYAMSGNILTVLIKDGMNS